MRALLVGNYGVGNLGDEALKQYFLEGFPEVSWTVVTASVTTPADVPRLPMGLRSFFTTAWWRTFLAYRRTEAVVFGGGTLFTDIESVRACRLWGFHASVARFFRKPVFFAFQGIGPFRTPMAATLAKKALRKAFFLSVRDEASYERAKSLLQSSKIVRSFDPVISLLQKKNSDSSTKNVFSIIPRGNSQESFFERAKDLAQSLGCPVTILSLQPEDRAEQDACAKLCASIPGAQIVPVTTVSELRVRVEASKHVLSARYHGALAALALGIPFEVESQGKGDKLSSLNPSADRAYLLALVDIGEKALREAFGQLSQTSS